MNKAAQSSRSGMKEGDTTTYQLDFLSDTATHTTGSHLTVVEPYMELGRASSCGVRYPDDDTTVSRRHVAIERRKDQVFLINLSQTNPTLLNGHPIEEEWPLFPGDVIQLSVEGPKIRYAGPVKADKEDSSADVMQRVGVVIQQLVKTYRAPLLVAGLLLLGLIAVGIYFFYDMRSKTQTLAQRTDSLQVVSKQSADSLLQAHVKSRELEKMFKNNQASMQYQLKNTVAQLTQAHQQELDTLRKKVAEAPGEIIAKAIQAVEGDVFSIRIKNIRVEYQGQVMMDSPQPDNCHCTGFLLDNGRFVTARHCIDLHYYQDNEFNMIANNGGKVTYEFYAVSSDKKRKLSFTNHDFKVNRSADVYKQQNYNGQPVNIVQANLFDGSDWAVFRTKFKGTIMPEASLSGQLSKGTELHCLGYTYGSKNEDLQSGLGLLYSKASVAKDGLTNNTIIISGFGFDSGHAGAPLFMIKDGQAMVVAIVSAAYPNPSTGRSEGLGAVVPISNIR